MNVVTTTNSTSTTLVNNSSSSNSCHLLLHRNTASVSMHLATQGVPQSTQQQRPMPTFRPLLDHLCFQQPFQAVILQLNLPRKSGRSSTKTAPGLLPAESPTGGDAISPTIMSTLPALKVSMAINMPIPRSHIISTKINTMSAPIQPCFLKEFSVTTASQRFMM